MNQTASPAISRSWAIVLNRAVSLVTVSTAFLSYFWQPIGALYYLLDIVLRAYLHFIAGSMAHEAVHGHLGHTRSANLWWGRFAILPATVPFTIFRKTHLRHHVDTNIPENDPDQFLNTTRPWEIPFRALALPSSWVLWLWRHDRLTRNDWLEYALTSLAGAATYALIAYFAGFERVLLGLIPAAVLHSFVLWYNFAVKTHAGYSTGAAETRSHNYYGRLVFFLSFGLSMHRLHHMQPRLAWSQMANQIPTGTWLQQLRFERDMRCPKPNGCRSGARTPSSCSS